MHRLLGWRHLLALALVVGSAACGGGGGGNGGSSNPTATPAGAPTPSPSTTPGATNRVVIFTLGATAPIQGVQVMAFYPADKGGFAGSGDGVDCGVPAEVFTPNDTDDGTLIFSIASAANLTLPLEVRCTFALLPGAQLVASDVSATVTDVAANGSVADPAQASATVSVQ